MQHMRIGTGFDAHRLVQGRPLVLGGVEIPHSHGLEGHSDADALLHALCDAMLGALALGDLGKHFPPGDPQFKGANSAELLGAVVQMIHARGFRVVNTDATIIAEAPKLAPHIPQMRENLSRILQVPTDVISVKATTTEGMGYTGTREGIAAQAVVLLQAE